MKLLAKKLQKMEFMKIKVIFLTIISLLFFSTTSVLSQKCYKKPICDKEMFEDYDFQGQSSSGAMRAGDKAKIKFVTYGGQSYKIFVCADPELGQVQYKILDEIRRYEKVVKEVLEQEVPIYKENEYGAYETDDWGDYIEIGREMQYDTIWDSKRVVEEKLEFNSAKGGDGIWLYDCEKTKTWLLEVEIPGENQGYVGCVDIMIGHRSQRSGPRFY